MSSRLRRSMLFVPGNQPGMVKDAHIYGADSIIFDLEDSVSLNEKDAARLLVACALEAMDYGQAERVVRINGLGTPWVDEDISAMVAAGIDTIRLPKTEGPEDIHHLESKVAAAEQACGRPVGSVQLMAAIESPLGVIQAHAIATASPRLVAIALSAEDYVTSLKTTRSAEGVELAGARSALVIAAKAAGRMVIDTVFTDLSDDAGFAREVALIKQMGFDGKSVINPNQIPVVHAAFTPTSEDIQRARRVLQAAEAAEQRGSGVASLDGRMIDRPIVERAQRVLALATSGRSR